MSPPPTPKDVAGFLETDALCERVDCLEGTVPDEGTLPDGWALPGAVQGFLGIITLKLPAEGLSCCFASDVLEKDGDFLEGRFLVREGVCFSLRDATAFLDADSALSSFLFSSL